MNAGAGEISGSENGAYCEECIHTYMLCMCGCVFYKKIFVHIELIKKVGEKNSLIHYKKA